MGSLLDSFKIIRPKIARSLLNDGNLNRIEQVASGLPAIHRAGFEYQFLNPERGLDFQQCVTVTSESYSHLHGVCSKNSPAGNGPGDLLSQIARLCRAGLTPDHPIKQCIGQIWLEFDTGINRNQPLPSVFLGLHRGQPTATLVASAILEAQRILSGQTPDPKTLAALKRILKIFVPRKRITHVGFMLGRPIRAIRLIASIDSRLTDLQSMLDELQVVGNERLLNTTYLFAKALFPEIRLCMDIHEGLSIASGLECFFNSWENPGADAADVSVVLGKLREKGICSPEEREAIRHWASEIFPPGQQENWPESLILKSMTRPVNHFSRIETGFSHVKFGVYPQKPLVTKIYFGYRESFMEKNKQPD